MIGLWLTQIMAVIRLEMTKTFLSRRGLWTYLVALVPVLIFAGHSAYEMQRADQRDRWTAVRSIPKESFADITKLPARLRSAFR